MKSKPEKAKPPEKKGKPQPERKPQITSARGRTDDGVERLPAHWRGNADKAAERAARSLGGIK